ncbi:ACP S-malonyltransferase [Streptomyces kunmingensis]|uniref:ACP S-malonyltransferase n=1 Tax=Streptomyces kunmingensis TaxID=68225 RepID=A0ABU6CBX5_9ACTN|nr:ACP S-malonyltransferase [Streptomyces kunmingensis]MEB3961682.1 ACP S-malonyltransferase [Streptomyces kunmingensis]
MALASIFGTNQFRYEPGGVIEFYDRYEAVRESFAQAAAWTGLDVEILVRQNGDGDDASRRLAVPVGLAAAQLGIQDVLAAKGLRPHMAGGMSLGGMVASCVAGACAREELMGLLMRGELRPLQPETAARPEPARQEALASAYLGPDDDPRDLCADRDGVFLSCDFGWDRDRKVRIVMLSGYRDALEKLSAETGGLVSVTEGADVAEHSPLRAPAREVTRGHIGAMPFTDPALTLCSSLEQKTLTRAEEVRAMFTDNVVEPISVLHLTREMKQHGAGLGLIVGPSPILDALHYPFPVVFVDSPAAVPRAVAAVFEHGVSLRR